MMTQCWGLPGRMHHYIQIFPGIITTKTLSSTFSRLIIKIKTTARSEMILSCGKAEGNEVTMLGSDDKSNELRDDMKNSAYCDAPQYCHHCHELTQYDCQ